MKKIKGEVWFAKFKFEDIDEYKYRPVVILDVDDTGDIKVLVVKVTTKERNINTDVPIVYWKEAKLKYKSFARVDKFLFLEDDDFDFKIGNLEKEDLDRIEQKFIELMMDKK